MSIRRMPWFCRHFTLAGVALGFAIPAWAQVGYLWTPEELTEKADAVVSVEVATTRDTKRTHHPSLRPPLPVVAVEAELRVLAWLKPPAGPAPLPSILRFSYFRGTQERTATALRKTQLPYTGFQTEDLRRFSAV